MLYIINARPRNHTTVIVCLEVTVKTSLLSERMVVLWGQGLREQRELPELSPKCVGIIWVD